MNCRRCALLLLPLVGSLAAAPATASDDGPPLEPGLLFPWLKSAAYKRWTSESAATAARNAQPSDMTTYLNVTLEASLKAKARRHPTGAAAVKELYDAGGQLSGWSVMVKTGASGRAGRGWYWYAVFSTTDPARFYAASAGAPLCVECHEPGKDYVLSAYPLR